MSKPMLAYAAPKRHGWQKMTLAVGLAFMAMGVGGLGFYVYVARAFEADPYAFGSTISQMAPWLNAAEFCHRTGPYIFGGGAMLVCAALFNWSRPPASSHAKS